LLLVSFAGFRISRQPPDRVVFFHSPKMDPVEKRRDQGAMDPENSASNDCASLRIYAIEDATH